MPMDFPDMKSLLHAAECWKFRQPETDESEQSYRQALANFVAPKDFIESEEIRNGKGWDKWDKKENSEMIFRSMLNSRRY